MKNLEKEEVKKAIAKFKPKTGDDYEYFAVCVEKREESGLIDSMVEKAIEKAVSMRKTHRVIWGPAVNTLEKYVLVQIVLKRRGNGKNS